MYIKKINIKNFGKLSGLEIIPSKGLNVIYAPNESGKTTLLSFMKYVFYGTKQKKHPGDISFKEKYMPWSGMPIDGNVEFVSGDTQYSISRIDGEKNSKLSVFDVSSGNPKPEIKNPGECFFGFGENALDASCFVKDVLYSNDKGASGELMSHLLDLGGEDRLYCRVRKELDEKILNLSSQKRKNARITVLDTKINDVTTELFSVNEQIKNADQKLSQLPQLSEKAEKIRMENIALLKSDKEAGYIKLLEEKENLLSEKTLLEEELSSSQCNLNGKTASWCMLLLWFSVFATLSCTALSFYTKAFLVFLPLFFVLFFVALHKILKSKILSGANVEKNELIKKQLSYIESSLNTISKKIDDLGSLEGFNDTLHTKNFTNGNINDIILRNESEIARIESDIRSMQRYSDEKITFLSERALLQNELARLEEQKEKALEELHSLELAIQILDSAMNSAKSDVFPKIREITAQIFSYLTERPSTVSVGNELEIFISRDNAFRDYRSLSSGSADALYFALRLALVEVMSQSGVHLPIFIDDSFATLDDERCVRILDIIYKISQRHQVFLCTCRSREGKYFENKEDVNIFAIQKG